MTGIEARLIEAMKSHAGEPMPLRIEDGAQVWSEMIVGWIGPVIHEYEADLREQIAEQIEALPKPHAQIAYRLATRDAAGVVREGGTPK